MSRGEISPAFRDDRPGDRQSYGRCYGLGTNLQIRQPTTTPVGQFDGSGAGEARSGVRKATSSRPVTGYLPPP